MNLKTAFAAWLLLGLLWWDGGASEFSQRTYYLSLLKAADHLAELQDHNGTWAEEAPSPETPSPVGTDLESTAWAASALLAAHGLTKDPAYLQAASQSGNRFLALQRDQPELPPQAILLLYQLGAADIQLSISYAQGGRMAARYLATTRFPTTQACLDGIYAAGPPLAGRLAAYVRMFQVYGYTLRAKELIDDPARGLLALQASNGAGKGAFLTQSDFTPDQDQYSLSGTVDAVLALFETAPLRYSEAIRTAWDLLLAGQNFRPILTGSLPAGYAYDRLAGSWNYLPWRFTAYDQAQQALLFGFSGLLTESSLACRYLVEYQRSGGGWLERTIDWEETGAEPLEKEFIRTDAVSLAALGARLGLNRRPFVRMAGWMESDVSEGLGGLINAVAWTGDPDGDEVRRVEIFYSGLPTGITLEPVDGGQGVFLLTETGEPINAPSGGVPGNYLLEMRAFDEVGGKSFLWPYFTIDGEAGAAFHAPFVSSWETQQEMVLSRKHLQNLRSPEGNIPVIYAAGFDTSAVSFEMGGPLKILAWAGDLDGRENIASIELFWNHFQVGISLRDDGSQGDYAAGDGVYGLYAGWVAPQDLNGLPPVNLLELVVIDREGNASVPWPWFRISSGVEQN